MVREGACRVRCYQRDILASGRGKPLQSKNAREGLGQERLRRGFTEHIYETPLNGLKRSE